VKSRASISAVIPIYNERAALPGAIEAIDACLAERFVDHEIIIVESGSTDGTAEACDEVARTLPRVRVAHEGRRSGFGNALRLGYALATKEWTWPYVVDMPYSLDALDVATPYMTTHDCVLSYRSQDPRGAYRRLQSAVFNWATRWLLGVRVRHVNSAFKLVKTSVLRRLTLTSSGWLIDAELVMRLQQLHVPFVEIPVALVTRQSGRSTVGAAAVARTMLELFRLSWRAAGSVDK
jgi:glycosyltransferase involved in cell wall biosynthesis